MKIDLKTKITIGSLLIALLLVVSYCGKKADNEHFKEELKSGEKEKVIVDHKKKTVTKIVRKNDGTVKTDRIEGARKIEVTVSDDNKITIATKNKGTIFEPGVSFFYSKNRMNLGLEVQWLYWRKYGVSTGFGISRSYVCSAYLSVNYNFFSNTSCFIGLNDELKPVGGVKVAF